MPVYKDKDRNTWFVKFKYKDWNGQQKWLTKRGYRTKREALDAERDFKEKLSGSTNMLFKNFVELYKGNQSPRLKDSTMATKENIIDTKFLPFFGEKPLNEITTSDVLHWQNELLKYRDPETGAPYTSSYLKTVHNQLSALFNHAVKYYGLQENPARKVGNMGSENGIKMKYWTLEQYRKFSFVMMDKPQAYYCFEVLYWCGIREGELLALTWGDIDLDRGIMSIDKTYHRRKGQDVITPPKTPNSIRKITMPDFLCDELREYKEMIYEPGDRVFPVSKNYLERCMEYGCRAAGLEKIRIHDLRHSHVSLLIDLGYTAVAIAERVGHQSIDITYRYAHLYPTVQSGIATKLDALVRGEGDKVHDNEKP